MSHINVTINGRQYRMACEEGQEARLLKLAESLESRIGTCAASSAKSAMHASL
jgi:cell division protein ZapA